MSLEVTQLDSIEEANRNQWNHVVEEADLGSVYHRYGWLRAVEAGTTLEPRHLVVSKGGHPVGVLPNFVTEIDGVPLHRLASNSLGALGPVVVSEEEAAVRRLLEAVPDLCDGTVASHLMKTHERDFVRYQDLFEEYGYRRGFGYCYLTLDLTDGWEAIEDAMHSSRRRAIRQGHELAYEVVDEDQTRETMDDFYERYESVIDRVGGDRLPRSFFHELDRLADRTKVFSLSVDGTERGALLFLVDDEQSAVHYKYSAVTEDDFEYRASELIHEHAIKWGIENGYETYNFGGAEADFRSGLFKFKEKFGARPQLAFAWERGCSRLLWPTFRAGRALYHRMRS